MRSQKLSFMTKGRSCAPGSRSYLECAIPAGNETRESSIDHKVSVRPCSRCRDVVVLIWIYRHLA